LKSDLESLTDDTEKSIQVKSIVSISSIGDTFSLLEVVQNQGKLKNSSSLIKNEPKKAIRVCLFKNLN